MKSKEEILETKNWSSEYPNYMAENNIHEAMDEYAEQQSIAFAEWCESNYIRVHSAELHKSAWIDYIRNEVLSHGSDFHYTTLIKKVGKTTEELYQLFLKQQQ